MAKVKGRKQKAKTQKKSKKASRDMSTAERTKVAGIKPGVQMRTKPVMQQLTKQPAFKEAVCAITDPFCYRARNAKYPDGKGGGTLAMQVRGHSSMTTGTTNYTTGSLKLFQGALPYGAINGLTNTGSAWTLSSGWADITGSTNFQAYTNTYRIVSWGIVVRNLLPSATASGYVVVRKLSHAPAASSTSTNAVTYGSEVCTYPVYAGMEVSIIGKPSGIDSTSFQAQNTTTSVTAGWDAISIELVGGPTSGTPLDCEFVYNVEITLADANLALHEFIPPDAGPQAKVTTVASHIQSKVSSVVEGGIDKFGAHVLSKVEDLAGDALEGLAALFM